MLRPIALLAALLIAFGPLSANAEIKIFGLSWGMTAEERYRVLFDNNFQSFGPWHGQHANSCLSQREGSVELSEECDGSWLPFFPTSSSSQQIMTFDEPNLNDAAFIISTGRIEARCGVFGGCNVYPEQVFNWLIEELVEDLERDGDGVVQVYQRYEDAIWYCANGVAGEELCVTTDYRGLPVIQLDRGSLYLDRLTLEMPNGANAFRG